MNKSEMSTLNLLGESSQNLAIFKLKLSEPTDIKSLGAKMRVYSNGKLIHSIGGIEITLLQGDEKTYFLTFKRQLQLETKRTFEWRIVFANNNWQSLGHSVYKQPIQTNISSISVVEGKHEIKKGKEIVLGAFVEGIDRMESVEVLPKLEDNERLFKNKYVYLLCLEAK